MNDRTTIIRTLLLLLSVASIHPAAYAQQPLPGDLDLGHVKRDGSIHFIGGGTTGIGANATRIGTPSPGLLAKVVLSKYGSFETAKGLDMESFNPLSGTYSRDKDRVYFRAIIPGADPATVQAGECIHLVNTYHYTPVTVFKERGMLRVETPVFDPVTRRVTGILTAEVTPGGLRNIRPEAAPECPPPRPPYHRWPP